MSDPRYLREVADAIRDRQYGKSCQGDELDARRLEKYASALEANRAAIQKVRDDLHAAFICLPKYDHDPPGGWIMEPRVRTAIAALDAILSRGTE